MNQLPSIIDSVWTLAGFVLVGRRRSLGWVVAFTSEFAWAVYAIGSSQASPVWPVIGLIEVSFSGIRFSLARVSGGDQVDRFNGCPVDRFDVAEVGGVGVVGGGDQRRVLVDLGVPDDIDVDSSKPEPHFEAAVARAQ